MRYTDPYSKKQVTEYLHVSRLKAKEIYELKQAELINIKYGRLEAKKQIPLLELRGIYLDHIKDNSHYHTYLRYKLAIDDFIKLVGIVDNIKRFHYELYRKKSNKKINGIISNLNAVKIMLKWGKDMELIHHVPALPKIKRPKVKPKRILSNEEISQILNSDISEENRKIVLLYLHTGARANELLEHNFTWDDFDEKNKLVYLGDGNKHHKVELSNTAFDILMSWRDRPNPLPHTYTYIRRRINKVSKISGVPFTPHNLRGAAGAILLRNGSSIFEVSKFLGHSSVTITEKHYIDLLKEDYVNLAKKLEIGIKKLHLY